MNESQGCYSFKIKNHEAKPSIDSDQKQNKKSSQEGKSSSIESIYKSFLNNNLNVKRSKSLINE